MNSKRWKKMEDMLDKHGIKPLVGIIPANEDPATMPEPEDKLFWNKVHAWQHKGWSIALHGHNHVCTTSEGGINPVHHRSEFAGLSYDEQALKIREGLRILQQHGVEPDWFFAPSHTFDENTLQAILHETPIRKISDTIAAKPYKMKNGACVMPCQMGRFRKMSMPGYWTACYHPNEMGSEHFEQLEAFLKANSRSFVAFNNTAWEQVSQKTLTDRMLSLLYFTKRALKK